jgi:hypothetical protein
MNKMTELADLMGFNYKLFERMRDMHRSWLFAVGWLGLVSDATRKVPTSTPGHDQTVAG